MKTGIHIQGGKVEREAVEAVANAVVTIFAAAHETRMDQATVQRALGLVGEMGTVSGASISNCSLSDRS